MLLTYTINKTPATVISYLSDMNRFVSVHPVITKMKAVAGNKFIVHEKSNAGLLPFHSGILQQLLLIIKIK